MKAKSGPAPFQSPLAALDALRAAARGSKEKVALAWEREDGNVYRFDVLRLLVFQRPPDGLDFLFCGHGRVAPPDYAVFRRPAQAELLRALRSPDSRQVADGFAKPLVFPAPFV